VVIRVMHTPCIYIL